MTASAYKDLYLNLRVPVVDETGKRIGTEPVRIDQYLLAERRPNLEKTLDHLMGPLRNHFKKPGSTLTVFVGTGQVSEKLFRSWGDAWYFAKKPLWGKGSPEEAQIALQLALRFKVVNTTSELQQYCDDNVGLDCNGFVGNYLEHGYRGKPWDSDKVGADFVANQGVRDLMGKLGPEVKSINDLEITETYVMGIVDPQTKQVINKGTFPNIAHTVVTTPLMFVGMFDGKPSVTMQVVESTGFVGLTESTYFLLSGANHVFSIWRTSKKEKRQFRLRPVR
ncbi:MAG: hypothetical protein ABR555_16235 [Pyrinomonadaceae bacterium]